VKRAALFAGQGSQYVGMAADLADRFPEARALALRAAHILGFDLLELMTNGPADELTKTLNTQPALFLHESMILACTPVADTVDAFAGHSLGEFSALCAAGTLDFDSALSLVRLRGELMYKSGQRNQGTMAAVVGLDDEVVAEICASVSGGDGVIVPANYNSPGQVVISGSADLLRASMDAFKQRGARMVKELQVSGAFHSPLLNDVRQEWKEAVENTAFAEANKPVFVNVRAQAATAADELKQAAVEQMTSAVLWTQTLRAMHAASISHVVEVGPQAVLQGLVKRTLEGVTMEGLDKVADCERFLAQVGSDDHGIA
jgi:[acyl-carrier-protein] S-malonyltransferase